MDPELIQQGAPLKAPLVVPHAPRDEVDGVRVGQPDVRNLVDDRSIDLCPKGTSRDRVVDLQAGRLFSHLIDLRVTET